MAGPGIVHLPSRPFVVTVHARKGAHLNRLSSRRSVGIRPPRSASPVVIAGISRSLQVQGCPPK